MLLIAFLGGVLTLLSPCILPVVPFLLTRAGGSPRLLLLTLLGMALSFAGVASLAVFAGSRVVTANAMGRELALLALALSALALLSPRVGAFVSRPFVALGNRLDAGSCRVSAPLAALLIGVATGLLWAPCAGPVLGVILSGAMLQGANASTSLLLLAYGLGSALALGGLILSGRAVVRRLRPSQPALEWARRGVGGSALLAIALIASDLDSRLLAGTSSQASWRLERQLLERLPQVLDRLVAKVRAEPAPRLDTLGPMPPLDGAVQWLNSSALDREALKGKVVLVDFWTYDCINCQHSLPYVNAWAKRYADQGLVVIGVHTPEYAYEKLIENVRQQVLKLDIHYPVAIDNRYVIWNAFANQYWPAHYFIDARGQIRYVHYGEGAYDTQEQVIRELLKARQPRP